MLRIPHTVCVFPVPGGPWTSVNGNGADDGADDGADASSAVASFAAAALSRSYERRVCAADHRIAASCGSLKFASRNRTNAGCAASSSARGGGSRPIVRGIPSSGGANIAARIGACNLLMLCNASYACDADESFPAGASHHRRPSALGNAAVVSPSSVPGAASTADSRPSAPRIGRRTPSNASNASRSRRRSVSCQGFHPAEEGSVRTCAASET